MLCARLARVMARESFEIYYFKNSRWSVHATFEGNEREQALAEAQKIEKQIGVPVRLVRETFYPETNSTEEVVSWQSAKAKQMGDADTMFGENKQPASKLNKKNKPPPAAPRKKEVEKEPDAPKAKAGPPLKRKKKKKGTRSLSAKLLIVVSKSLLNSLIVMAAVGAGLWVMIKYGAIREDEDPSTLFASLFLISYVGSALHHIGKQFNVKFGWGSRRATPKGNAADMLQRMGANAQKKGPVIEEEGFTQADVQAVTTEPSVEDAAAALKAELAGDRLGEDEDFGSDVQQSESAPPDLAPPDPAPPVEPPPEPPKVEKAPEPKAEKPPETKAEKAPEPKVEKPAEKKPETSPGEAQARHGYMGFVGEALTAAKREMPELNAFSRFGLNLYLAGACAAAGQAYKVGRQPQLAMLRDGLQAGGNSRERAESFCAELPSHGKNPRYASMIQAGTTAMQRQLAGQPANTTELTALLADWSKPEKRSSVPSAFTFMFTDIVNSTALTSQLGNAGAQRVVRAHNQAVRSGIQACGGREVKHTGDGIMATFPTPAAAVQAGIRAQKELAAHNSANPSIAFTIRVGVNVGEAVEEDNDFFGAAVQMTARICAACTPANVWVSRAVVDSCKGERLGFIPRGAFQMKGIQQARPLYEVAYTDAHKNELANI